MLVAGCQRSGTTAITRILANSADFETFRFTADDELDAALMLSGMIDYRTGGGRLCLQTTYLNDRYHEYIEAQSDFRLVWVLRNPFSVIYSMVYNWRTFALEDLFRKCGAAAAQAHWQSRGKDRPRRALTKLEKACFSYVGKSSQIFELHEALDSHKLLIVDYDKVCASPISELERVFEFAAARFEPKYADAINRSSVDKAKRLTNDERSAIQTLCQSVYDRASRLEHARSIRSDQS